MPEPPAAVEKPNTNMVFDASPATIAAALAKAGTSPVEPSLTWRPGYDADVDDIEVEVDDETGAASPR